VAGHRSFERFWGKGANQAMAAARLGAQVALVGAVGDDAPGRAYRERLTAAGLETSGLVDKAGLATGHAAIAVEDSGENNIIVHAGANGALSPADVRAAQGIFAGADAVLLQFEVPLDAVLEAIDLAHELQVPVVLNPSPWRDDFPWDDAHFHTVVVNASELVAWRGAGPPAFPADLAMRRLVLTRGAQSTLGFGAQDTVEVAPPPVRPVDTVGAGDAFAGAYAVALAEGHPFAARLDFANRAGALATLREGAQEALPDRAEVDALDTAPPG